MRLTDILGLTVVDEQGKKIGHVYDVRGDLRPRSLVVTGLVVGPRGLLERLGVRKLRERRRVRTDDVVPWSRVVRVGRKWLVVRP